ncbi:virulence factor TspB C-terminal domain-related protein [Acinetobacter nosocomialis]|uniref:virulence factor TspB C-terminal domain-related protein n=1 Tax=Acinetobacter nosocomialis TaxID=106654 RepID=UPI00124FCAFD|nr:virulence factor TspB C-terminal domain-related protein [Acinetobacter nosocomialis]
MGSITSYCVKVIKDNFKLITWLQIFIIAITPNFIFYQTANATTVSAEGWSVTKRLVQGATTFYDGAKNVVLNGKNYAATGTAAITPTATQVSKMIVRTGAVLAVDLAIKALIGSVDYVMDPANNRVKYFVVGDPSDPKDPSVQYYYQTGAFGVTKYFSSNSAAATDQCTRNAQGYGWILVSATPYSWATSEVGMRDAKCVIKRSATAANETFNWSYIRVLNPAYNPSAPNPNTQEKYLPYDAVASQIISDAVANKADGKAYVSSVADTALEDEQRQIVPASDVTQQLNNSQAIPTNGTGTGTATPTTGTGTGDPTAQPQPYDITINFPIFCNWAPTVCQAAQAGINYVASYTKDVDALKKEYGDNPKFDDKPLEFDKDPATPDTTISFGGGCPAPLNAPYSFMGISGSIEIPFTPFCKIAEVSKPVIIAVSAYFAALIIGGIRSGDA